MPCTVDYRDEDQEDCGCSLDEYVESSLRIMSLASGAVEVLECRVDRLLVAVGVLTDVIAQAGLLNEGDLSRIVYNGDRIDRIIPE